MGGEGEGGSRMGWEGGSRMGWKVGWEGAIWIWIKGLCDSMGSLRELYN